WGGVPTRRQSCGSTQVGRSGEWLRGLFVVDFGIYVEIEGITPRARLTLRRNCRAAFAAWCGREREKRIAERLTTPVVKVHKKSTRTTRSQRRAFRRIHLPIRTCSGLVC